MNEPLKDEIAFTQLVGMFQMAAMQHMGKLINPVTEKVERDLPQAKASIDILEMLKRRTDGNLTEGEATLINHVLTELRMNFVDESSRPEPTEDVVDDNEKSGGEAEEDSGEKEKT